MTIEDCLNEAVIYCGLSPSEFWALSWYEWMLYRLRHKQKQRELLSIDEGHWARFRIVIAQIANSMRKTGTQPMRVEDVIRLSFDKAPEKQRPMTLKEIKQKLGSKFKHG